MVTVSCAAEIQILHNMQEAMNKDGADDSLDMYGKVVVNKLRLSADPVELFIVQNEIDQVIYRTVVQSHTNSSEIYASIHLLRHRLFVIH